MPETLLCPECQRKVKLPDHLIGKRVKCPGCGGTFTATPAAAPVAAFEPLPEPEPMPAPFEPPPGRPQYEEPEDDQQAFPRDAEVEIPDADVSAWFGVRTGLKLQVVSHCALAGGYFCLLLFFLVTLTASESSSAAGPRREGPGTFVLILIYLTGLALLTGWILSSVVGCFLLGTTPRRSARGLAVGTLLMSALVLLVLTEGGREVLAGLGGAGRDERPFTQFGFLFFFEVTRLTLLALFLRAMSLNLGQRMLGSTAQLLAFLTPSIMLGVFALTFLVTLAATPGKAVALILIFLNLGGWIGVLVFGVIVMLGLKQKLDRKLPRTEPA